MNWEMSDSERYRYDCYMSVVNMNVPYMKSIGFTDDVIMTLKNLISVDKQITIPYLCSMSCSQEMASRVIYLYKICTGKVSIETKEDLAKHLRRMFGGNYRIGIKDLAISNISTVPRAAVIAGIKQEPFNIYNSNQYSGMGIFYNVLNVSGKSITIKTKRKPKIERKQSRGIKDAIEIKNVLPDGSVEVTVSKRYIRLCNRFIIVASLRRPEFHHGMYEILCFEGTTVYVFASTMGVRESVKYSSTSQRVYDFGFFENQIQSKLSQTTQVLYNQLRGAHVEFVEGNQKFVLLDDVRQDKDLDDAVEY